MDKIRFREIFGGVYEHSPWLADAIYDDGIDTSDLSTGLLVRQFETAFLASGRTKQLAVLRSHPELACQRASALPLSAASSQEQASAGLKQCSDQEFKRFRENNDKYMNKYKFPFIIAVKGLNRVAILEALEKRLLNDPESEFQTALKQVNRIARFRIEDILSA